MEDMEEITEETDYVNVPEGPADKKATRPEDTKKGSAPEGTVDTKASPPGLSFVLPIAVCWIILLAIMGLRIYFHTLSHESDPNQLEEVSTLRANNTKLSLENANMKRDNKNLEDQLGNLTQVYNVSESNVKDLSAGVQVLSKLNQELETKTNNLNQKIQDMTRNWNELNISRAQWSIDSYCLGNTDKKCQPCQKGWNLSQSSCYAYNDPPSSGWKTWEEAREDCKGKNSDLAVAHDSEEKEVINENRLGVYGFWIGLRVEDEKWKWVDGSDLSSLIPAPDPAEGHCAMFYRGKWFSVSCGEKRIWICQKKALSV